MKCTNQITLYKTTVIRTDYDKNLIEKIIKSNSYLRKINCTFPIFFMRRGASKKFIKSVTRRRALRVLRHFVTEIFVRSDPDRNNQSSTEFKEYDI